METRVHYDHDGDKTIFESVQDCEPIVEAARALHLDGLHGSGDFKHAARIPNVIIERYCAMNGITFHEWSANKEHVRRVLNDPSLKAFRIWPGAV